MRSAKPNRQVFDWNVGWPVAGSPSRRRLPGAVRTARALGGSSGTQSGAIVWTVIDTVSVPMPPSSSVTVTVITRGPLVV